MIIVVHDNGIPGQRGYTEEPGASLEDVERIKARYTQAGITIYSIDQPKLVQIQRRKS